MELLTFIALAAITLIPAIIAITAANANANTIASASINTIAIVTTTTILPSAITQVDIDPIKFLLKLVLKASLMLVDLPWPKFPVAAETFSNQVSHSICHNPRDRDNNFSQSHVYSIFFNYMCRTFSLSRLYYIIIFCFSVAMIM
jgi:hypothetical protein